MYMHAYKVNDYSTNLSNTLEIAEGNKYSLFSNAVPSTRIPNKLFSNFQVRVIRNQIIHFQNEENRLSKAKTVIMQA